MKATDHELQKHDKFTRYQHSNGTVADGKPSSVRGAANKRRVGKRRAVRAPCPRHRGEVS